LLVDTALAEASAPPAAIWAGTLTSVQAVPLKCSVSIEPAPLTLWVPTPQASQEVIMATPASWLSLTGLTG